MVYYVRDGLVSRGLSKTYKLETENNNRFLRLQEETRSDDTLMRIKKNATEFKRINNILEDLEFTENQRSVIYSVIAAILNLGDATFAEKEDGSAVLENREVVENVSELLEVDLKKLCWALTNYCVVRDGKAHRKRNSCDEARDARDVLANTLYARLVDYIVNEINNKLSIGKQIL